MAYCVHVSDHFPAVSVLVLSQPARGPPFLYSLSPASYRVLHATAARPHSQSFSCLLSISLLRKLRGMQSLPATRGMGHPNQQEIYKLFCISSLKDVHQLSPDKALTTMSEEQNLSEK